MLVVQLTCYWYQKGRTRQVSFWAMLALCSFVSRFPQILIWFFLFHFFHIRELCLCKFSLPSLSFYQRLKYCSSLDKLQSLDQTDLSIQHQHVKPVQHWKCSFLLFFWFYEYNKVSTNVKHFALPRTLLKTNLNSNTTKDYGFKIFLCQG